MLRVVYASETVAVVEGQHDFALMEMFQVKGKQTLLVTLQVAVGSAKMTVTSLEGQMPVVGDIVVPLGRELFVSFPEKPLGRILNGYGDPLDGKPAGKTHSVPVFASPTPLIQRELVDRPLHTGILAIDWMLPLGRGQRELILGDTQTGKSTIALTAIDAQVNGNTACIYVSVGQRGSSVVSAIEHLKSSGALTHSMVIDASASAAPFERYIAPYSAMAIAEQMAYSGLDVLLVFDDMNRQAEAYRELSLLLDRSPGRESYPGDIFYAHSSLLERAGAFKDRGRGRGSISALPIYQTQEGDITSYIATNLIAITDGQIYLSRDLAAEGRNPPIDLRLSVSRIGARVQSPVVRELIKDMKVDLSVYEDSRAFLRLANDSTASRLAVVGATVPLLLRQDAFARVSPGQSLVLLSLYAKGRLKELSDPETTIMGIKRALADPVITDVLATVDVDKWSKEDVDALTEVILGPTLQLSTKHDGIGEIFSDRRLYDAYMVASAPILPSAATGGSDGR